jgi:hypothetical protein
VSRKRSGVFIHRKARETLISSGMSAFENRMMHALYFLEISEYGMVIDVLHILVIGITFRKRIICENYTNPRCRLWNRVGS